MHWTKKEIDYLIRVYPSSVSLNHISKKIRKSKKAITHKAARLELSRPNCPINKPREKNHRNIYDKRYYEKNKGEIYEKKKNRIRSYKQKLLKLFGSKCSICGYNKCVAALEFHHKNNNKDKSVTRSLHHYSKQKALKEAEKCIILCANCHREVHHKERLT